MTAKHSDILFIQLPTPLINFEIPRENTLNAAGYLISYYKSRNLDCQKYNFIIPEHTINDYYGDSALLDYIEKLKPTVIGFSYYCWNISRTIYIASEIKKRLGSVRIIFGGPEITPDNSYLLLQSPADFLVAGEGEAVFEYLLASNFQPTNDSRGLILPNADDDNQFYFNGYYPAIKSLDEIRSPYLTGILKPEPQGFIRFETMRGCRNKCSYCF